jgi:hypothetical protein
MSKNQLRTSQIVMTFGPGAMVDLPEASVIISGLDQWHYEMSKIPIIDEPRLVAKLRRLLEIETLTLRTPPQASNQSYGFKPDVVAWRFPEWFIVQNPRVTPFGFRKRQLVHMNNLNAMTFQDEDRKKYQAVPVRFVRACRRGHVGDIDWKFFVHGNSDCLRPIWLEERGLGGDLDEMWIVCDCGKERAMSQVARPEMRALGHCNGSRPWLGARTNEPCGEPNRLLIRSASNAYFAQLMTVISIPDTKQPVDDIVKSLWEDFLIDVESLAELTKIRRKPTVAAKLQGKSDEEVFEAIERFRSSGTDSNDRSVKEAEFEALTQTKEELGSDTPDGDFFARSLPTKVWAAKWMDSIERVVLVHRLREVIAQVGFTRFEAFGPNIEGELDLEVERAALALDTSWLPAVENRGEGIFLHFKTDVIKDWLNKPSVKNRGKQLLEGYQRWASERRSQREFPGIAYYLLHSLSHLLLTVIALDCGYPSSALRERVYSANEQYGILIYTGSSDSQGTLGGLVQAGREIKRYMLLALERAMLCSNDPICAHHSPAQEHDPQPLLGSACHGCLLVSETSCEQSNSFLDRSLVVQTIEGLGAEFFDLGF